MSNGDLPRYRLDYDPRATRQLDRINPRDYEQISSRIKALAIEPSPRRSLKLRDGSNRFRWRNWRVLYLIDRAQRVITITDVLRRNERTYRDV